MGLSLPCGLCDTLPIPRQKCAETAPQHDHVWEDLLLPLAGPNLLLLDVGGVLLANAMDTLLDEIAARGTMSRGLVLDFYLENLRRGLWAGECREPEFWDLLIDFASVEPDKLWWRTFLLAGMTPLPGLSLLPRWRRRAQIWILSNHRHEWLRPSLAATGMDRMVDRTFISSETGHVKPEAAAFPDVLADWPGTPEGILYVDDAERNLDVAAEFGMNTVQAASSGEWTAIVDDRLLIDR